MSYIYRPAGTSRGTLFAGVGHGGPDPGAVGFLREKYINLRQALHAKDYWVSQGFTVVMSRNKDENDPLTEEIREANASGAICAIDFHNNAGKGNGFEAIYSILSDARGGKLLAQYIEAEVEAIGQNSRGCKTRKNSSGADYYGFVRQTKMPANILEGCFVDNAEDVKLFDTDAELKAYGHAVAKGTIKWLEATGRVKPVGTKPVNPKPAPTETGELAEDGFFGYLTAKATQKVYGTPQDGEISNQYTGNKKYLPNADADAWEFLSYVSSAGSTVIRAIQEDLKAKGYYKGRIDGQCGPLTVEAIQKFLKARGFYKGDIDQYMGPLTVEAWQQYINSRL